MITTVFLIVLGIIILIYLAMGIYFAKSLLYPMMHPINETPEDYGMKYENISYMTEDNVELKGWYIPTNSQKLIIIVHPGSFSRAGFDPKQQGLAKITKIQVKFLPTVKQLNEAGYNVLFFDLRNHGDSGKSKSKKVYLGLDEYKDIIATMNYINSRSDLKSQDKAFLGFCTGANSTIIAMNNRPNLFQNIKCLIAVQPISGNTFVWRIVKSLYTIVSAVMIVPLVTLISRIWSGKWFSEMNPLNYCNSITCPVLYIQAKTDKWASLEDIREYYDNSPDPKELVFLEDEVPMHRFDTYNYFGHKPQIMLDYYAKHFKS
ncbi:MAG: prolyl oligopeptidase family serine peptidase [Candidatus Lokiarchaeota archaeon]|nr:prolyl oligopeptidase family serine peptidase [Candidatus Lokiarchaeota archaeon]